jgi:hypothetical protein
MKKSRANLKITSVLILILVALTLIKIVAELIFGDINVALMPSGAPENLLLITKIFVVTVSLIMLLPQIYLGVKGIWASNNRGGTRIHIPLAVILFVITVLSLISPIVGIIKWEDVWDNVFGLLSIALQLIIYFEYIKYSREVASFR